MQCCFLLLFPSPSSWTDATIYIVVGGEVACMYNHVLYNVSSDREIPKLLHVWETGKV